MDCTRNNVWSLHQSCRNGDPVSKAISTPATIIWTPQCYFAKYLRGKAFKMLCNLTQRGFPEFLFLKSFTFLFKSKPDLAYQFLASTEVCYLEINSLFCSHATFSSSCFPQCNQYWQGDIANTSPFSTPGGIWKLIWHMRKYLLDKR